MRGKDSKRSSLDRLVRCFDERSRMSAARVLAFLDTGILSGPARQLIAAIPLLRERGYDVRPVVYQSGEARTDFRRALEAADIDYSVLHYGTRRDLLSGKLVEELIRKEGPRIIQTHNFRPAVGVSLSRRATRDLPWVAFYHGHTLEDWKVRVYNGIERILLQRSDVLVTVAERQRRRFPFARRLETIPNAVLPSARQGPSRRPAEARAGANFVLGYIGRLSHEKGVDILLRALAQLSDKETFTLRLVGDGPDELMLRQLAVELGVEQQVEFVGRLASADAFLETLDALVLPSRSEGMPNVLLEAAAKDVPMVATDVGDVRRILSSPHAGTVVPAGDVPALAAALLGIVRLAEDPRGIADRRTIVQEFGLERRIDRLVTLYDQL